MTQMAKIEFSVEKIEERFAENMKQIEVSIKKTYKNVSLKWIEVEDTLKA